MLIHPRRTRFYVAAAAMTLVAGSAFAQEPHAEKTTTTTSTVSAEPAKPHALTPDSVTEGTVTVGGKPIAYKAVAGLLRVGSNDQQDATIALDGTTLPDSGAEPPKPGDEPASATMFYTAYFAKGENTATRPIVFIYNGGPGSATMYLRMSSFGPVRVVLPDLGHPAGGPYKIVPNEDSLLDAADLVFIDAPGTGYSRVMGKDAPKSFFGIDQDAAPSSASSAASSPSTIAGIRRASSSARVTAPRAMRCSRPRCSAMAST